MNNKALLGVGLLAAGILTACTDDRDSNPTLIQPAQFVLNTPPYVNEVVDLGTTNSLRLTWSQPKFTTDNAPINVTYEVQVSPTGKFTVSTAEAEADESGSTVADYSAIDKTVQTCTYDVAADDVCKALVKVSQWTADEVPAEMTAHLRVSAFVQEGMTRLGTVFSNTVEVHVTPYYIELKDAAPIMWYLVGNNLGDGAWSNKPGESSFPMFVQSDYTYDKATGAGEITYLNYFNTDGWKIQPADFNWDYGFMGDGANSAIYRNGAGDNGNIWCDPEGYYLVTVNTGNNTCTIKRQDIEPYDYGQICLSGSFNGWTDTDMLAVNKSGENHVWCHTLTVASDAVEQVKFKIKDSWDTNWGYGSYDGEISTCGKGAANGKNIGVGAGTWIIMFNDITGEFSIIEK